MILRPHTNMNGIDYYILIALMFVFAGIYVWQRSYKNKQNISFGLICVSTGMWLGGLFYLQHAADFYWADKLTLLGGLFSIAGFYMFSVVFPSHSSNISFRLNSKFKNNFYVRLLPLALWVAVMPFNLIIKGAVATAHGPVPVNGPLFPAFGATEIIYIAAAVRNFYFQFKNSIGHGRQKIVYVLAGMCVFLISVIIFDLALPSIKITALNFIGPLSSLVFLGMSAMAIISFNLFDVRLVLKNVLVYAFSAAVTIATLLVLHDSSEGRHIFSSRAFIIAFLGAIVMFAVIRSAFNFIFQKYFLRGYYRSKLAFALLDSELIQPLDADKIVKAANRHLRAGLQLKWIYFYDMRAKRAMFEPFDYALGRHSENFSANSNALHGFASGLRAPRFFYGLELPGWNAIADSPTGILPIWDGNQFFGYFVLGPQMNLNGMSSEQMYKTHAAWAHLETALARAALRSSLEEQVKAQVQDITYKNRKLKEAAMMQLDYAQMVSHQLRTPVTVLQGALELVLNPGLNSETQKEILSMARQSSMTLSSIIEDVLSLARIRKASGREKMTAVDLHAVMAKIMPVAKPLAKAKNINLIVSVQENLIVKGNSSYLEQALFNIIENALQHAPQNGEVSVLCTAENSGVLIKIADNGPGIPAEMQKSIFKKHIKTSRDKGIGLGLYIVKAVIDAHPGGKIWFGSSDKGTEFFVQLRAANK